MNDRPAFITPFILLLWTALIFSLPVNAQQTDGDAFIYRNQMLLKVITDIEMRTGYKFLYREAQLAGIRITVQTNRDSLFVQLRKQLNPEELDMKVNTGRKQVIIFRKKKEHPDNTPSRSWSAFVVDDDTGERLPFATVAWTEEGRITGVSANSSGFVHLAAGQISDTTEIQIRYTGYQTLTLPPGSIRNGGPDTYTFRLEPAAYTSSEITVEGRDYEIPADSMLQGLVKTGTFGPLGENNSIRSLQILPAVNLAPAVSSGLNIRGSATDGFRLLLDGLNVYNQYHLFGMVDAMNAEVLRNSGFHYDIAPAQYQAPLGGTLSLITKTGSVNRVQTSAGITNSAASATAEGPLWPGRASWVLSGRYSFLDEWEWMNNRDLIEYGLDVNRPAEISKLLIPEDFPFDRFFRNPRIEQQQIENTDAGFYDLHAKTYVETGKGAQLILSGYHGRDETTQQYFREVLNGGTPISLSTANEWQSSVLSGIYNRQLSPELYTSTTLGYSDYEAAYRKDDYRYQFSEQQQGGGQQDTVRIFPLLLDNQLFDFTLRQHFTRYMPGQTLNFGISYQNLILKYREQSLPEASFRSRRTGQLLDAFLQADFTGMESLNMHTGIRVHYFSNGEYLKWSPRIKLRFLPDRDISFSAGFSRNYQFLHKLQFYNIHSTDFWIMSNEDQPPSAVNYLSSGITFNLPSGWYARVEGYLKWYENLRLHQLNTVLISETFTNNGSPWYVENTGYGRGLEFLLRKRFNRVNLTGTYTLSKMEMENERINDGRPFYPEWDRRHQAGFTAELSLARGLTVYLSSFYATGAPDRLDLYADGTPDRMEDIYRTDLSMQYSTVFSGGTLDLQFSVFNLFNRDNPWYKEVSVVRVTQRQMGNTPERDRRLAAETVVQDLGIQPSFSIRIGFGQ